MAATTPSRAISDWLSQHSRAQDSPRQQLHRLEDTARRAALGASTAPALRLNQTPAATRLSLRPAMALSRAPSSADMEVLLRRQLQGS